jgi:hypothetical protein
VVLLGMVTMVSEVVSAGVQRLGLHK